MHISTDEKIRKLEREANQGDEDAQDRLQRVNQRAGIGRHANKLGKWVTIDGVRDHYRGILLSVSELGGGMALLHLAPCFWLQSLESKNNEIAINCTADIPFDLSSLSVTGVALQPTAWD